MLTKNALTNLVNRYRAVLKKCRIINIFGSIALAMAMTTGIASAEDDPYTYQTVYVPSDSKMIELHLLDKGVKSQVEYKEGFHYISEFTLSAKEQEHIVQAVSYWTNILKNSAVNTSPAIIEIRTTNANDLNASAYSPSETDKGAKTTNLGRALMENIFGNTGALSEMAYIDIHHDQNILGIRYEGTMANLPSNGNQSDLTGIIVHEMAHSLGMHAYTEEVTVQGLSGTYNKFATSDRASYSVAGLYSASSDGSSTPVCGKYAAASTWDKSALMEVGIEESDIVLVEKRLSGLYFTGKNVQEVLNGAVIAFPDDTKWSDTGQAMTVTNGIPMDSLDYSHIELQNGLMSHQRYRNWNILMEAELAYMEDIGLKIDRRNYYGYSVYNSGTADNYYTVSNTNPYYARNSQGNGWIEGEANNTDYGIGLHLYGSYVDFTQNADLLSSGNYGIGIRNDGSNNILTVDKNTTVAVSGYEGIGLLTAYGCGNEVNVRGKINAVGEGGIAVRFDFGDNMLGNLTDYRGSYIHSNGDYDSFFSETIAGMTKDTAASLVSDEELDDLRKGAITEEQLQALMKKRENLFLKYDLITKIGSIPVFTKNFSDLTETEIKNIDQDTWTIYKTAIDIKGTGNILPLHSALNGPMVKNFNLTGSIKGTDKAIYIGKGAYVQNMNVMNGASISGDIVSDWDPIYWSNEGYLQYSGNATELITELNFGVKANSNGSAEEKADPAFNMRYNGNIDGSKSMNMNIMGGTLSYNGNAKILNVNVNNRAVLKGNATYTLNKVSEIPASGTFTNNGTIAPGNSLGTITINGDYVQSKSGVLSMEYNGKESDTLTVNGNAVLDGTLSINILNGYYKGSGTPINAKGLLSISGTTTGSFQQTLAQANSPTIAYFEITPWNKNSNTMTVYAYRKSNAYSQYATNINASYLGQAFYLYSEQIADPPQALQELYSTLDFSSKDGSVISSALRQMSPDAYGNAALTMFDMHRVLTDTILPLSLRNAREAKTAENRVFLQPFTSFTNQERADGIGYKASHTGAIAGVEHSDKGISYGAHIAFDYISQDGKLNGRLRGEGLYLGAHGAYSPEQWKGIHLFGAARIGVESMDLSRSIAFSSYSAHHSSNWTGFSGSVRLGTGWNYTFENFSLGPIAYLDYVFSNRPSTTEDGSLTNMKLDSSTFNSLRASIGAAFSTKEQAISDTLTWHTSWTVTYNRELLDKAGSFTSSFACDSAFSFNNDVEFTGKNSMGITGELTFTKDDKFSAGLMIGADLFRSHGNTGFGKLEVRWKF